MSKINFHLCCNRMEFFYDKRSVLQKLNTKSSGKSLSYLTRYDPSFTLLLVHCAYKDDS